MSKRLDHKLMMIAVTLVMLAGSAAAGNRIYDMEIYLPSNSQQSGVKSDFHLLANWDSNQSSTAPYRQVADRGPSKGTQPKPLGGFLSEVRLGVLKHDFGPFSSSEEEGIDFNLETLFVSPGFLEFIWSPRPHLGISVNSGGDTDQAYFGLTWEFDIWKDLFVGLSFGGSVHNGETATDRTDKKELGCRWLFRESLEVGYRITGHHAITAFFDHVSNAGLCDRNEGLETLGVRYGYRF